MIVGGNQNSYKETKVFIHKITKKLISRLSSQEKKEFLQRVKSLWKWKERKNSSAKNIYKKEISTENCVLYWDNIGIMYQSSKKIKFIHEF